MNDVCEYKHLEDFCVLEKGECHFQGKRMECTAKEEDLVAYCPDCDFPADDCKCWSEEKEEKRV